MRWLITFGAAIAALLMQTSAFAQAVGGNPTTSNGGPPHQGDGVTPMVKYCVEFVRQFRGDLDGLYTSFDAYYDPAAKMVFNNATRVGDQRPLFVFQKCMTEHGIFLNH